MERIELTAAESDEGHRLDQFLSARLPLTCSAGQTLFADGHIMTGGGEAARKNRRVAAGERYAVSIPDARPAEAAAQDIPLDIVYEDADVLVVNKRRGMVVHPAAGNADGTLVNALLSYCGDSLSGINGVLRPGIVHRIDRDTSGLLIVAKNDLAHAGLAAQLADHTLSRVYEAVVAGNLRDDEGTVDAPIGRHPVDRKRMAVTERGSRRAVTHYRVLERYPGYTYIECRLETGRTHQIRVHMAHIGHPVLGDPVYGPKKDPYHLGGQCLHARELRFVHPRTGEQVTVSCPLPEYFSALLTKLRRTV